MRAASTETLAEKGVHRVAASFEDLRWGPVVNRPHDLGTDIFVQVWPRGFDIGIVIGVQVKTGDSHFSKPVGDPDAPSGWWYAETTKNHFNYWTGHALPHLLILHEHRTHVSYWVHVTTEAVQDTGQGAKILVPSTNTLDLEHVEELLAVAGTARANVAFEGSAWTGGAETPSTDQLRFALIAPRLIATRRRDWFQETPSPEQVVALIARAQFDGIDRLRDPGDQFLGVREPEIPSLDQATESDDWRWRFTAALEARILRDDLDALRTCVETADTPDRVVASTVALAAARIESGDFANAITSLDAAISADEAGPVDNAWLHIQRARALLELGDLTAARKDANEALGVHNVAPHDVTASAIDAAAQALIFTTAEWDEKDYGTVIRRADTAVSWWRAQTTLGGLEAVTERTFESWANDQSTSVGGPDVANNQLYIAALGAGHSGDHGSWRHLYALLAQDWLIRLDNQSAADKVAEGLGMLRRAGAEGELKQALSRIANDGPCAAITTVSDTFNLDRATHTTILADLVFVERAGDLFSVGAARRALAWLSACFDDDPGRLRRLATRRAFDPRARLLETINGFSATLPDEVADFVVARLPNSEFPAESIEADWWRRLLRNLPTDVWSQARVEVLTANGFPGYEHPLRHPILGVARHGDSAVKAVIGKEIQEGSLEALLAANYGADLDGAVLVAVRTRLRQAIERIRTDAAAGKTMVGGLDPAYVLAVVLLSHDSEEDAACLANLLIDEDVARTHKQQLLELMARDAVRFREIFGDQLLELVDKAAQAGPAVSDSTFNPDITGEAAFIAEVLKGEEPSFGIAFAKLLAGTASQRRWAARLAAQAPGDYYASALLTLVPDHDPLVRQRAAAGIARLAISDQASEVMLDALRVAATDPGRAVPIGIAAELGASENLADDLEAIRVSLVHHASAAVRNYARRRR
jgi:hypothetical protein